MELLLQSTPDAARPVSFWSNPSAWLREKDLGRPFWVFFTAALFFDAGFSVYVFLFNLFLLDVGFNERAIGLIGGATTFGSVLGTLPAGLLGRKIGVQRLLILCFLASPLLSALRTLWLGETAQIALGFLTGLALSTWGVCFLPAVARLTTETNRTSAFSLIFSASIGTSTLGGVICGYLPKWLSSAGLSMQAVEVKRLILLVSCGVALLGLFAVLRLRMPPVPSDETPSEDQLPRRDWFRGWKPSPFLFRFLPLMALWCAVLAAFTPFANVYLSHDLHVPLSRIGLIFSTVQLVQFGLGLVTPLVFRRLGLINGIAATQIAAAVALASLAAIRGERLAVVFYLTFSAAQWMSSPGLYNLLMNETPDKDRSTAAAMTLFCNALVGSAATAGAGVLFSRFGYPPVLLGIALLAVAVSLLFRLVIGPQYRSSPDIAMAPNA